MTRADNAPVDSTTALYTSAIGDINTRRYLKLFTQFESQDRIGISWNWASSLCTLNWLAFRRLWGAALVYCGAVVACALLVFGIGRLVFQFSEFTETGLVFLFAVLAFALPGMFGDAVFYAQTRKRMAFALGANETLEGACAMLKRQAATKLRLGWLGGSSAAIAAAVASGYAAFPPVGGHTSAGARPAAPTLPISAAPPKPVASAAAAPAASASAPVAISAASPDPAKPSGLDAALNQALSASGAASAPVAAASAPAASAPAAIPAGPPALAVAKPEEIIEPAKAAKPATDKAAKKAAEKPQAKPVKPQPKPKAKPSETTSEKVPAKAAAASNDEQFYLNAGLFADDNNARNVHGKLMDAGLPSVQLEMNTPQGKRTRVRVGPFDSISQADTAARKIRTLGLDAVLVRP